jgi:protein O-GlcNAc transferase
MGLFDRLRSAGQTVMDSSKSKMNTSEQDATRLIDEGHALEAEGRLDEAMQRYLDAIRLAPNPARAHLNRGNILLLKGDLQGALDAFRTAIKHKPDYAGAYYNIGNALLGNKQLSEAVASYRRALEIQPDYAEVHCSLGVALKELGQLDGAIESFQRALGINPDLVEARTNLGNVLQDLYSQGNVLLCNRRFDAAVTNFRQALLIEPNVAEVHYNLGHALQELGQFEAAVESFRRTLEIEPDNAYAYFGQGLAQHGHGQYVSAAASYRRALEVKPDFAEAHSNLGLVLQDLGQLEHALKSYRRALEIKPDFTDAQSNLLFILNYTEALEPSYYFEQARQYGSIVAKEVGGHFANWQCVAQPERLRVGLMSGDLRQHVVVYFLEGLLAHIDPARFELIAYPTHHEADELTARIRTYFSAWNPLFGQSDEAAARLIHADGVHVLLDLSGHTAHNRLPVFAWKPAPVQVSWLGYFATTGVAEMDYLLADEVGVPETLRKQFTESVWYLPDTRLCFTAPVIDLPVSPLPALANGMITFGCFQNLAKVGDNVLEAWREIFAALPNARLRIQCTQLGEPAQVEEVLQRLQRYGIAPAQVLTHGSAHRETYLAAHAEVDIILDTFPYPGGTTTCEALWMGVPTVTLAGDSLLARQGASLLTAAGLEEWVATSKVEYIAKAIALANDKPKLAALRAGLRQQVLASPLFDTPRFARNFEDALWGMWQSYQARL